MNPNYFLPERGIRFYLIVTGLLASVTLVAGVDFVHAQTPSAPVSSLARASRGGPLAPTAVFPRLMNFALPSLRPAAACGNQPSVSTARMQTSWGGMSASAPTRFRKKIPKPQKTPQTTPASTSNLPDENEQQVFALLYENFRRTYRLGPGDEVAVRVRWQPDYSLEKAKISPDGRLYHPLLGDVLVGGLTVDQLSQRLTEGLTKYILAPEVSVQLVEAKSAKIGVLGEVQRPGILVMNEPLTVLDAVTQSGGIARTGKNTNVTLIRQTKTGRLQSFPINVKRILAGKADVEENLPLQPGDTVIVHGNLLKKLEYVTATIGFTQFLAFIALVQR
jgi:polysaccharide export outer membrane protein